MKILYDHQIFTSQRYGGISRYFFELMKQFSKSDTINYELALKYSNNFYLCNSPELCSFKMQTCVPEKKFLPGINFKGKAKITRLLARMSILEHSLIINKRLSVINLKSGNFDIFHPTYYDDYFLRYLGNKPYILTVYDMIHERFSGSYFKEAKSFISEKKELIRKSSHIIAISENTKKDIIDIYKIDEKKISVVYLGNSFTNSDEGISAQLSENYILFIGDRHAYKNFEFFIKAIAPLLLHEKEIFLVCAGSVDFSAGENALIEHLGISEKVIHLPLVNDATLSALYRKALCFVFPTLYEGFGIPVLEAFACGCPALLSNTSSLPEVGGNAALYFNPEDSESILETVKSVVYSSELADKLRQKGYKQLKKFSWERCAFETRSVYEKVL